MKTLTLPLLVILLLAGLLVFTNGSDGAGAAALVGVFLVGFGAMLLRKESATFQRHEAGFNERRESDFQFLWFLMLAGALLRVVLAMGMRHAGVNEAIAPDEYTFHDNGRWFLGWLEGDFSTPFSARWQGTSDLGYFAVVGTLYYVFGVHAVVPVLLNCLIGALCAVPAYHLAGHVAGRRSARAAAVFVTFFPSLVLWSTLLIRDAAVLLLVLWTVVFVQRLLRRFSMRTLILLVVCLGLLATLRAYLFVLITVGGGMSFVVAGIRRPGRAALATVGAVLGAVLLVKVLGLGADTISRASLEHIAARRHWNSFGAGGFDTGEFDLSTPTGALTYLPYGLMWFLLSPFPWQSSGRQALAIPDVLVWYVAIPLVVVGLIYGLRRRRRASMAPLLCALLITVLHSLWEGNVGIIFRHRAHVLVLFLPFAAVGLQRLLHRARRRAAADRARASAATRRLVLRG